jgi:sugar/nucleoside kinase (ribokinase family)
MQTVSRSDIVCVLNWSLNEKGTDLAKSVFKFARKYNVKTFFDTGDPNHRKNEIPELIKNVIIDKSLDILGLNENELLHYGDCTKANNKEDIISATVSLKEKISGRIDLHTSNFACTVNKNCTIIPSLKLSKIYRITGAGDAWNAGNLFAELLNFDDDERLLFANIVAGCYITSSDPIHPSLKEIINFIKNGLISKI